MNDYTAHIHVERIDQLMYEVIELSTDVGTPIKKVKHNLINRYGDASIEAQKKWGMRRSSVNDITIWLRYAREKTNEAIGFLQQLSDELDDIEDEINRDEVNNAK